MKTKKIAALGVLCCISLLLIGATVAQAKPSKLQLMPAPIVGYVQIEPGEPVPIGDSGLYRFDAVFMQIRENDQFYMEMTWVWHAIRDSETQEGIAYGKLIIDLVLCLDDGSVLDGTFKGVFFVKFFSLTDYETKHFAQGTEGDFRGMKFRGYYYTPDDITTMYIIDPHGRI